MLHDALYEDMDPDYQARVFLARQRLVKSVLGETLLPDEGLQARTLLNGVQLDKVRRIRSRRLEPVLDLFIPD
ncbi:MAG: hypothetical protein K1X75_11640 [Leptospirales bacterium]|nr:hypothetical protein [Leptospirales bacterium]